MNQQDSNADVHLGKCAQTSASEDHGHPVSLVLFTLLHVYCSLLIITVTAHIKAKVMTKHFFLRCCYMLAILRLM